MNYAKDLTYTELIMHNITTNQNMINTKFDEIIKFEVKPTS